LLICELIKYQKSDIMPGQLIFRASVAKSCDKVFHSRVEY
jgi:hypothetical protein